MMENIRKEKGITLIALIITIIILLILAMVSIKIVVNNGIIDKAKEGIQKYKEEEVKEASFLNGIMDNYIKEEEENNEKKEISVGDYIYIDMDNYNSNWIILKKSDNTITVASTEKIGQIDVNYREMTRENLIGILNKSAEDILPTKAYINIKKIFSREEYNYVEENIENNKIEYLSIGENYHIGEVEYASRGVPNFYKITSDGDVGGTVGGFDNNLLTIRGIMEIDLNKIIFSEGDGSTNKPYILVEN